MSHTSWQAAIGAGLRTFALDPHIWRTRLQGFGTVLAQCHIAFCRLSSACEWTDDEIVVRRVSRYGCSLRCSTAVHESLVHDT